MIAAALLAATLGAGCDAELVRRVEHDVVRTAIVCHGVVIRRARLAHGRGRVITDVAGTAGRLAWGELRRTRGRWIATVHASDAKTRVVARSRGRPRLQVVLSSRGDVGWLTRRAIHGARGNGPSRLIARGADLYGLALEDDRTLRWKTFDEPVPLFADLRPWPRGECPQRSRYEVVAENAEVIVTKADYGGYDTSEIVRACARATGTERIISWGYDQEGNGYSNVGFAVQREWAIVVRISFDRYYGCNAARVLAFSPIARRYARAGTVWGCDTSELPGDDPIVVTDGRAIAWIARDETRSAVMVGAGSTVLTLDTAGPDGITGLVADRGAIRWFHDGAPRTADLG